MKRAIVMLGTPADRSSNVSELWKKYARMLVTQMMLMNESWSMEDMLVMLSARLS
jgi:hypothetical protein